MLLRRDTRQRIARTQAGGMLGRFMLYRKADIYIDLDKDKVPEDADGSEESPLNSFAALFEDDEVECTCRNICCDKIVVRVKGELKDMIDGQNRDYAGNLVVLPWQGKLELKVESRPHAAKGAHLQIEQHLAANLHGVMFRGVDFVNALRVDKDGEVEDGDSLSAAGEINIFRNCRDIAVVDCKLDILGEFSVATLPGIKDSEAGSGEGGGGGWSGGGGGGGGGVGGGGGGGGGGWGSGTYGLEKDWVDSGMDSMSIHGVTKTICVACCFRDCPGARVSGSSLSVKLDIRSSTGSQAQAFGLNRSAMPRIENSFIAVQAGALDAAWGWIHADEDGRVGGFDSTAIAVACPLALCRAPAIADAALAATATANANPYNLPTVGGVGGISTSEAYDLLACPAGEIVGATGRAGANASHPTRWTIALQGLLQSEPEAIAKSSFPVRQTQTSHAGAIVA